MIGLVYLAILAPVFLSAAAGYSADWQYGATLIRDSYFEDYAQQLAEDCAGSHEEADQCPHD